MRIRSWLALLFLGLLSSFPAFAQDQRLAVLEIQGGLPVDVLLLLSDGVRAGALDVLNDQPGYCVMTRENTIALL